MSDTVLVAITCVTPCFGLSLCVCITNQACSALDLPWGTRFYSLLLAVKSYLLRSQPRVSRTKLSFHESSIQRCHVFMIQLSFLCFSNYMFLSKALFDLYSIPVRQMQQVLVRHIMHRANNYKGRTFFFFFNKRIYLLCYCVGGHPKSLWKPSTVSPP